MNQFQSIDEVFAALRRRGWLIVIVAVVGCVLSVHVALGQVKAYEATAVVQIEDARLPDQLAGASASQSADASRRVRLIEQRLMARDNLVNIMEKHDLFTDRPGITMNERVAAMREAARIQEIVNAAQAYAPGGNAPSGLIITVRLNDAQKAADVANDLMTLVIDQSRDRSSGRARETLDFFSAEETRIARAIEAQEGQIAAFKRENAEQIPDGVTELRAQLGTLRDTDLDLDQQIVTLEATTSRQREEVTARQVELLQDQKLLITERIAQIEALLAGAPEVERELNRLERELTKLQDQYSVITRRKAEAEMGQLLEDRQATDRFEVLETALVPEAPVSRSRKQLAMMGGFASILAGLAAAFIVELMNPAIRSAAQMERMLGVQPVVSIPTITTRRDRTIGGLKLGAKILMFLALIAAGLRLLANRVPALAELAGRFLPRRIARG